MRSEGGRRKLRKQFDRRISESVRQHDGGPGRGKRKFIFKCFRYTGFDLAAVREQRLQMQSAGSWKGWRPIGDFCLQLYHDNAEGTTCWNVYLHDLTAELTTIFRPMTTSISTFSQCPRYLPSPKGKSAQVYLLTSTASQQSTKQPTR